MSSACQVQRACSTRLRDAIHDGLIYVTDAANGYIVAFNKEGEVVDWLNMALRTLGSPLTIRGTSTSYTA